MKTNLGEMELVIFDWSGVISDDRRPVYEATMRILESFNKPRITYEKWWKNLKMSLGRFLLGQGIILSQEEINQAFSRAYKEVVASGLCPKMFPEVLKVLSTLRREKVKLAVVSAHPPTVLEEEAQLYRIREYFLLLSGWSSSSKEMSIFETYEKLGVRPERAAYVGDMVMDVRSAKKAEVHSVAIARKNNQSYHSFELLEMEFPEILARSLIEAFHNMGVCV